MHCAYRKNYQHTHTNTLPLDSGTTTMCSPGKLFGLGLRRVGKWVGWARCWEAGREPGPAGLRTVPAACSPRPRIQVDSERQGENQPPLRGNSSQRIDNECYCTKLEHVYRQNLAVTIYLVIHTAKKIPFCFNLRFVGSLIQGFAPNPMFKQQLFAYTIPGVYPIGGYGPICTNDCTFSSIWPVTNGN